MPQTPPFLAVAYSFIVNECGNFSAQTGAIVVNLLRELILFYPCKFIEISQQIASTLGRTVSAIQRINEILKVASTPIPNPPSEPLSLEKKHKRNPWSEMEDDRLFAGIHKYGLSRWFAVAKFVGNGRTKAQCSQRWNRSLTPQLQKTKWTDDEDQRLAELVGRYGLKSWTRIAFEIDTRSDVQCRYRWHQLQRHFKEISTPSDPAEEAPAKQRMVDCLPDSKEIPPGSIWD
jgi:hypothetical protein